MSMKGLLLSAAILIATYASTCAAEAPSVLQPSEDLEQALLKLEKALNGTSFCYRRIRELWAVVAERKMRLDKMQEQVFAAMDKLAKIEFVSPILKECPAPFEKNVGGCYYPSDEKIRKWTDARLTCGRLGGDLAYPKEVETFRRWAGVLKPSDWGYFYLGGRADPKTEFPVFRWLDGRRILNEEKYRTDFLVFGEDFCIVVETHGSNKIKNKDCKDYRRWFMCEIKVKED